MVSDDTSRTNGTSQTGDTPRDGDTLLTPGEVARLFRVDPKTVTRWAASGHLGSIRTPGGHRRFWTSEVYRLLDSLSVEATRPPDPPLT